MRPRPRRRRDGRPPPPAQVEVSSGVLCQNGRIYCVHQCIRHVPSGGLISETFNKLVFVRGADAVAAPPEMVRTAASETRAPRGDPPDVPRSAEAFRAPRRAAPRRAAPTSFGSFHVAGAAEYIPGRRADARGVR